MKNIYARLLIGGISFTSLGVNAYFENTYWCVIEDSIIQVSLTTGDQHCLDYMAGLSQLTKKTTIDLQSAANNVLSTDGYDREYWVDIVDDLTEKKKTLINVQEQIVLSMQDFEQELFVRIKGIVGYYLLSHTSSLEKKISQGKNLLTRLVLVGNKEQHVFVRTQMNMWEHELIFLDRIKQSSDFAGLLPPLKRWIKSQETRN